MAIFGAVQGLATVLLTLPVIGVIAAIMFRRQLGSAFDALVVALSERGGTLDATIIKFTVPERPVDLAEDVRPLAMPSLFDVVEEAAGASGADLQSIAPQLKFELSDKVAQYWESKPGGDGPAAAMRLALKGLREVLTPKATFETIRPLLIEYARSLEASRYREAKALATLLDQHPILREGIALLQPKDVKRDADEFVLLHAVGVAYAQDQARWLDAYPALHRIAWNADNILYARAGTHWVAAAYHQVVEKFTSAPGGEIASSGVISAVETVLEQGQRLLLALESWDGAGAPLRKGYYLREIYKDLGSVTSIFAAHILDKPTRQRFLDRALPHNEATVQNPLGSESPSPIDHNNIAHFYRQLGDVARKSDGDESRAQEWYTKARTHATLAFADGRPSHPAYHDTLALLLNAQGDVRGAYDALTEYTVAHARTRPTDELQGYFENQILAAKLLLRLHDKEPAVGLAAAIDTVRRVLDELGELRRGLAADDAESLEAQMQELLGYLYLASPAGSGSAVAAFERLLLLRKGKTSLTETVRANTGAALAFARAARAQRRESSPIAAETLRHRAAQCVATALAEPMKQGLTTETRLTVIQAAQLLAEERFAAHEDTDSTALVKTIADLLPPLRQQLDSDDSAPSETARMLRRLTARHALVSARLEIRAHASPPDAAAIKKIEELLLPARTVTRFSCEADLEIGVLHLHAARSGGENARRHWQAAVDAFERAGQADVPTLRAEVYRQVSHAYAIRGELLKKTPAARKAPASP